MSRVQVVYLHVCVVLTALTGIVFAAMKYLMKPAGDFSVINHPLQPYMLSAHVVIAPFLVFGFGWLFGNHIWPKFRYGEARKRASGLWSMAAIVPMTLSGYLLQISTEDATRTAMAVGHWITSGLFVIAYVGHWISRSGRATDQSAAAAGAANVPSPT
ncbi:MAG TPA: hypothetical protein VIM68_02085 [Thermoanaerobaculia bacterium]